MTGNTNSPKPADVFAATRDHRFLYFSELLNRPVCAGKIRNRVGRLTDLVFSLSEPYPEAVGVYVEHGWGKPTEFIPWDRVVKIDDDAVFVQPPESGDKYPPFVDHPGWMLLNEHLMGKTILDMDGRRTEVVNDVHLLESKGRMIIVHVDISFNGFLRKWGLGWFRPIKDRFISWRYVQPLSLEDAVASDTLSLSITRDQVKELPSEDLADALEELSGEEQTAVFSLLDSEKAAETLMEAEPRAQRQIIANLRAGTGPNHPYRNVDRPVGRSVRRPAARRQNGTACSASQGSGRPRRGDPLRAGSDRGGVDVGRLRHHAQGNHRRRRPAAIAFLAVRSRHGFVHLRDGRSRSDAAGRGRFARVGACPGRYDSSAI